MKKIDKLLTRTNDLAEVFDAKIAEHKFVRKSRTLKARAERISAMLHDFYQEIGHKADQVEQGK